MTGVDTTAGPDNLTQVSTQHKYQMRAVVVSGAFFGTHDLA